METSKPKYVRIKAIDGRKLAEMRSQLKGVPTVCAEAACPNLSECWRRKVATYMILGDTCTRNCGFCGVKRGVPNPVDPAEPLKVAESVRELNLRHCVITSVTRDDLPDGGAQHYADVIRKVRELNPSVSIEVLIPDFHTGGVPSFQLVAKEKPDVLNHNIETVKRLYPTVRKQADYERSLDLLHWFATEAGYKPKTKSGMMVGLGEEYDEVLATFQDLLHHQVEILTVGQYLRPTQRELPVVKYWAEGEFHQLAKDAVKMGFKTVAIGPLVRSSYFAEAVFDASRSGEIFSPRAGEFIYCAK